MRSGGSKGAGGGRGRLLLPSFVPPPDDCIIRLSAVKIVELLYMSLHRLWRQWSWSFVYGMINTVVNDNTNYNNNNISSNNNIDIATVLFLLVVM